MGERNSGSWPPALIMWLMLNLGMLSKPRGECLMPVPFLTDFKFLHIFIEPDKIQSLHCRPQTSTAIACSWTPPDSDFDGYSVECKKLDTREVEFSKRIEKDKTLLNIMTLVPHKRYLVSIKVHSADMTSEVVEDSTITMIDRKWNAELL